MGIECVRFEISEREGPGIYQLCVSSRGSYSDFDRGGEREVDRANFVPVDLPRPRQTLHPSGWWCLHTLCTCFNSSNVRRIPSTFRVAVILVPGWLQQWAVVYSALTSYSSGPRGVPLDLNS